MLSDPYQRGRYDQQREQTVDDGDDVDDDDADRRAVERVEQAVAVRARRRRSRRRARGRAREPLPPTISPPDGTHYPATQQRIIAMAIDLGVLLLLVVIGTFAIVPAVAKSQKPEVVDRVDQLNKIADQTTEAESTREEEPRRREEGAAAGQANSRQRRRRLRRRQAGRRRTRPRR